MRKGLLSSGLPVPGDQPEQGLKQVEQADGDDALEPRDKERGREGRAARQELLVHEDERDGDGPVEGHHTRDARVARRLGLIRRRLHRSQICGGIWRFT